MSEMTLKQKIRRQVNLLILRNLPPCKEIAKIISASLDRRLTLREKIVMKLHLVACKPCVRYFEQSEFLHRATQRLDDNLKEDVYSGRLSDEARARIKDLLKSSV